MSERPLHVMQLLPALQAGGVEQGTVEVANALIDAGHRASVVSAGGQMLEHLRGYPSSTGPAVHHIPLAIGAKSVLTLRHVRPLRALIERERPDIIHARSRLPAWIGWLALRNVPAHNRPRFITTAHGFYSVSRYSAIMARGERVIAVSEAIRRYLEDNYSHVLAPDVIDVIHRGVDRRQYFAHYRPNAQWLRDWQTRFPPLEGRRYVVLPARLTRLKGHLPFVDLIATLRQRGLDAHGLIVGGEAHGHASYANEVRAKVAAAGLAQHVEFLGHRTDLRDILSACDLSVSMSTRPESFGRTVLEALSLGRPVVGFAHGGVAEILGAMYPMGAVPPGDAAGAAEAAHASLVAAREISPAPQFDLHRMLTRTLEVYRALVESERAPTPTVGRG